MRRVLGLVLMTAAINAQALYYGTPYAIPGDNLGGVQISQGDSPLPTNAVMSGASDVRGVAGRYLKLANNRIQMKSAAEQSFVDLAAKYKKQVAGQWVEMSATEKYMVDLPAKYKHADGTEMSPDEKTAVDAAAEQARQDAKPAMLKQIENMYVSYLTNDWTMCLRDHALIGAEETVTVQNTVEVQNMAYLMTLRAIDHPVYLEMAEEFKLFQDTMVKFGSSAGDAVWHQDQITSLSARGKRTVRQMAIAVNPHRTSVNAVAVGGGLLSGLIGGILGAIGTIGVLAMRRKNG